MLVAPHHQVQEVRQVSLLQAVLGVGSVLDPVLVQHKHIQPVLLGNLRSAGRTQPETHNTTTRHGRTAQGGRGNA